MFDYSKLKGRVIEKLGSMKIYADRLGISETQLSKKINNRAGFSQADIIQSCKILDIATRDIGSFFFALKV